MFELTGQITYILPTMVSDTICLLLLFFFNVLQITLIITRGVGDWFGSGGIADRYIRLNGYPILENTDQVFGVPGKNKTLLE
jgi:chloride channel 3/4/5